MREKKKFFVSRFRGGDGEKGDKKGSQPKKLYLSAQPSLFLYLLNPLERLCFIVCFTFFPFAFCQLITICCLRMGSQREIFSYFQQLIKKKKENKKNELTFSTHSSVHTQCWNRLLYPKNGRKEKFSGSFNSDIFPTVSKNI